MSMSELASTLRGEVAHAAVRLRALSEADVTRSRGDGKWVKKEILGHLIDSAANNHQRFVRAQFSTPFVWPGYDQEAWVPVHRYRDRPWADLVDLWVALNRHVAVVVEGIPVDRVGTSCAIGGGEAVTLEELIQDYLRHLRHHLAQIEAA